ncbi:MAG: hypothetical protein MJ106_07800 [Lentisphaeria bacterium]|nr:hypothetical protein [Lentisphaeria bacterium]
MESMDADGLDVAGDLEYITPELVQKFHDAGKLLGVWTIDDLDIARKYVELGVDVITSNRASFLKDNIRQQ